MNNYFITDGIGKDSIKEMVACFSPEFKKYQNGETIMRYSDNLKKIGLLSSGRARLSVIDIDGEEVTLEQYANKDVFGELFCLPLENYEYIVTATEPCQVIFIDYKHIITPCEKLCPHHSQLINNLFLMAAEKSQSLSLHLSILNQHSIRKKLLTYLKYVRATSCKNPFEIDMSLVSLAEYLCVDRSAMMREIRIMKREGILKSNKREFLLYDSE